MRALNTIVACTDFTPESDAAVRSAAWVARTFGARLAVVHVVERLEHRYSDLIVAGQARRVAEAEEELGRLVDALAGGLPVSAIVREGSPAHEVLEVAVAERADLVVFGRHGRSRFESIALGTVAERLLYKIPCDILLASSAMDGGGLGIGVATDFSEASTQAAERALEIARATGTGRLRFIHAFEVPHGWFRTGAPYAEAAGELRAHHEDALREQLAALDLVGVEVDVSLEEGHVSDVVQQVCDDHGINLVVSGSQGRSRAATVMLGRHARRFAHSVKASVWITRPEGQAVGLVDALRKLMEP